MAVFVSAGVYVQEKDNSLYAPAISPTTIGIVGTATKGPLNTATLITNEGQLIDTFGYPRTKDRGMHAAVEALKACRIVYFVRIAGASASNGTVNTNDSGSGPTNPSFGPSANNGPYNLENGLTFSLTIEGAVTHVATVSATAPSRTSGAAGAGWNFAGLGGWPPAIMTITIDGGLAQTITFQVSDFANPALAQASEVANAINGQIIGAHCTFDAIAGTVTIFTDRRGTGAIINISAGAVATLLGFTTGALAGTGNVSDVDAVTATEIKTMIELLGGGTVYSVGVGTGGGIAYITRQGPGGVGVQLTLNSVSTAFGASPLVNITPLDTMRAGTAGAAPAATVSFTAATKGSHSSNISVVIAASSAIAGTLKLQVYYRGNVVETYDKLWKNAATPMPTGAYALITTINSGSTDGAFPASDYITAADLNAAAYNPAPGTYTLTAGNNGDDWTQSSVIGTIAGGVATGMQQFADPERIFINVFATPGISFASVIAAGINLCQSRADCIYVVDCPIGLDEAEVVRWHNGDSSLTVTVDQESHTETNSTVFNSSYAALYYPFTQIYDKFNDSDIWIPPSAIVLRTYAYTDEVADPWFAPAGPNRTQAVSVLDLESSPSQGERDLMYMPGNNVNPIANVGGVGIVIMGQKTLQRAPTALDRVNVRRLLLAMERVIARASFFLLFEPNDAIMWRRFINLCDPVCRDIKARRGLYDFRVVADSSTTTALDIDRNTFKGQIYLQPTKAAEIIIIPFNLVPTGANFEEFAQA